jgi:hypothetical protein
LEAVGTAVERQSTSEKRERFAAMVITVTINQGSKLGGMLEAAGALPAAGKGLNASHAAQAAMNQ